MRPSPFRFPRPWSPNGRGSNLDGWKLEVSGFRAAGSGRLGSDGTSTISIGATSGSRWARSRATTWEASPSPSRTTDVNIFSFGSLISSFAPGQTRTATASIGITVQRHSAILLPADASGVARLSTGAERFEGPAAAGNATPTLITVDDSRSLSPVSSARAHVAVTVFEP